MKLTTTQLLAAHVAASNKTAVSACAEIIGTARELAQCSPAETCALAMHLSPGQPVVKALRSLQLALADAADLVRAVPAAHAAAMVDLQAAFDRAAVRRQQIAEEIEALDLELATTLSEIDRPIQEWDRWQRFGLTRREILQRGGIEPGTYDPQVLEAARQAARKKRDEAVAALVAERDTLTRWRNTLDSRLMPEVIRDCWSPPAGLLKMLEGL